MIVNLLKLPNLRRLRPGLLITVLILGIIASGCLPWGRGTYQVEVFYEMHYAQSHRSQEPPRLYPAPGAVPFTMVGDDVLHVQDLVVTRTAETEAIGEKLYNVNCIMCHGIAGDGSGPVRAFLIRWGGIPPANLTGPATTAASDQDLHNFIAEGGRIGYASQQAGVPSPSTMPTFRKLLTAEEQWMLVHYLRDIQGQ